MGMKLTPKALKMSLPKFVYDKKSSRDLTIEKIIKEQGVS
jgi:hypothetical protein